MQSFISGQRMLSNKFLYALVIILCIVIFMYIHAHRQNKSLQLQYNRLRKEHGALSCKCNGIGPSGGFCLNKNNIHVGGNELWCKNIANEFRRLFNGQSVYDFGAGLGWYGKILVANTTDGYRVRDYQAFDGAENIEEIFPDGFVQYLDLSQPVHLPAKDWVLSLEVGEHIPAKFEQTFIENLHRHNKKGIVLSWALINQGGHFHVNNRDNAYIKNIFKNLGYSNDLEWETRLRNISTLDWFKRTLMVFRR